MRRQTGFSLIFYGVIVLAILAMLSRIAWELHHAGYESAVAEYKPKLEACQGQVAALVQQIAAQNAAVASLKAAGDAKVANAARGLNAARSATLAARTEADRLRAASARSGPTSQACPAGEAVRIVREGLK